MTQSRGILYRSSQKFNTRQHRKRGRKSKCFRTTLHTLANCTSLNRTGKVTWQSS